ncbi:MAG: hypothetical protein E6851_10860 [Actinomyces urogenitalis]|uniref:hypothetical protein n=1 Tax=Actinomyces urogenitalis TaxID=103621 RepID=UPI002904226F|nr:hypothetical protein [Actinomyces urogenitalis]MDU1640844.1 hypothetical protein [Actinomyces urogenitalis]
MTTLMEIPAPTHSGDTWQEIVATNVRMACARADWTQSDRLRAWHDAMGPHNASAW